MPFDQPTRNRLARFVADARSLLSEEFTRQLQHEYGMDPGSGDVAELTKLGHLDDARRETARILRATLAHYLAGAAKADKKARQETLQRIVREQAYTVLNRLAALRMAEARGLLIESVGRGYQSRGFQLYAHLAGPALGETGAAYRSFLFSLFDELAVELPALFDRFSPQGRLFPREASLLRLLDFINAPDLEPLWGEDETLGWIYQYFNSSEERRQMRAESQAPRNSRELAVRNQFFTPRYVVEFLTDNTLGRIWYEMTQGRTALAETCRYLVRRPNEVFLAEGEDVTGDRLSVIGGEEEALSQEELLRQPVTIPFRPLKDPRELKLLDPACGSMHFGLYAFDLFERIYEEAWDLEASGYALLVTHHAPLHTDYPTKEVLSRAIPRLIIEHNIHGIDIDPRAVQIAGLSLWLRAQRSWQAQGVKPQDRPRIQRSNIVCAEPMPGDKALLEEFLAGLRADRLEGLIRRVLDVPATQQVRATARMADALCDLVRVVWDEMKLAGEAGSLLKIEQTLANAVRAAEREWSERMPLFRVVEFGMTGEAERVRYPRTIAGQEEGADFWTKAEALVLAALHDYAEQAQNGAGYQRRLFASDAARGFAFIDLCGKLYDVVLMNPPFGPFGASAKAAIQEKYDGTFDLFACFIERALELIVSDGRTGAITTSAGFYRNQLEDWRAQYYFTNGITVCADLGGHVLDGATVRAAAYAQGRSSGRSKHACFVRCNEAGDKPSFLIDQINALRHGSADAHTMLVDLETLNVIPGRPLAYWMPPKLLNSLATLPTFSAAGGTVQFGFSTKDDFRFLRLAWEIDPPLIGIDRKWVFLSKGGEFSPYYFDIHLLVNHQLDFRELEAALLVKYPYLGATADWILHRENQYGRSGITFQRRTNKPMAPRVLPEGCFFSDNGPTAFWQGYDNWLTLAVFNSVVARLLAAIANGSLEAEGGGGANSYEAGIIANVVVPASDWDSQRAVKAAQEIVELKQRWDSIVPETRGFAPAWLLNSRPCLQDLRTYLQSQALTYESELRHCQESIDAVVCRAYGVERDYIYDLVNEMAPDSEVLCERVDVSEIVDPFVHDVISTLVGSVFGRWDLRLSIRHDPVIVKPDPFAPLPPCPPGMLQNAHGLPATPADVPADYPLRISWPGILVDQAGHPEDIEARVRDALRALWPDNADAIEQEACQILGVESLREYFASPGRFFDDHLKRYSKSRRAAPIYWPLSTASGSYTLWLYYHRLSDQTLYWCVNDFVEPRLKVIGDQLSVIRRKANRSREEEREMERLSQFETELREFRDELLRVAAWWRPNLNDGVQITAAPLWRLFRHRAWQRRLKETWEQLEAGDYDWAHLALSIWPARVVPKCVTDRSLAIAHDLEEVFWVEDPPGSWRNLHSPDEEIEGLVATQRSPARERLAVLLAELARGRARGLRCAEVWDELAAGRWDDLEAALLLWPERVAEACWDDPLLAVTLQINLPTKRTKATRERFVKERVAAGCPDLAAALEAALRERPDRFASFWSELARGDHDHLRLALALWPARVVAKCAVDVELADGHEVRRFLWVRGDGVWKRRNAIEQEVADEIIQRQGSL